MIMTMIIKMASAFLLAFLFSIFSGKYFIPWVKEKGFKQPLKEEVAKKIYSDSEKNKDNSKGN